MTTTTISTPVAQSDAVSSGQRVAPVRRRIRHMTAIAACLVGTATGVGTAVLPSAPAAAAIATPYYVMTDSITCNTARNTAFLEIYVTPKSGYSGMQVSSRTYLELSRGGVKTGSWSAWSSPVKVVPGATLAWGTLNVGESTTVRLYTEVVYWTASGWSAKNGSWAKSYQAGSAYPYASPYCQTHG